ncbi:MAG: glycosyltransferase [Thermomicrobiales bacterium]|nr:glycosyltransferase [Thermomicrobiales bacterium]MCO5223479.1 glycosyltransferase [Thermomicrobiales bacterium]
MQSTPIQPATPSIVGSESLRVGLVHDYLTQFGGAERVLVALTELFPEAPIFCSISDPSSLPEISSTWDVRESALARLPGASTYHRAMIPIYPAIFRRFEADLRGLDIVIVDSSAWAHHVPVSPTTGLLCYCHSPARFLYGDRDYLEPAAMPPGVRHVMNAVFGGLRRADRRAAERVDRFIANSRNVAARIERTYRRHATVIYPPVDIPPLQSDVQPEEWYLVVSRLVPHKRIDLAVRACSRYGIPLKVVGSGRSERELRAMAGPTVELLGRLPDDEVADLMTHCKGFMLPGSEDFGISAVEAQAAGRPVIAFGAGGALESVIPGETGVFFSERTAESLMSAIRAFETISWNPVRARANAERFSKARFQREIMEEVRAVLLQKQILKESA